MPPLDSQGPGAGLNQEPAPPGRRSDEPLAPAGGAVAPATMRWRRLLDWPAAQSAGARSADIAGALLARLTVLPALLILSWLIPGLPLLLGGAFLPVPMLLISVPLAVALIVNGLRVVPSRWPRLLPGDRTIEPSWATWFGLLGTIAVVAGLTGWQLTESSSALIVLRDPGTYLQTGYWIAQHGSLPVPQALAAFGGAHPGLSFASTGFLARGTSLYPAVLPGLPMLLAGGFWVHGVTGAAAMTAVLGGLATLSFAGLVARLAGPQWAPAGALVLGLCLPQQYIGRTSLSETALQILLFGGLCLLADSLIVRPLDLAGRLGPWLTPPVLLAALAGASLGFGLVVSFDALVYLLPVIPVGCVLVCGRRPQASAFLAGNVLGVCFGLLGCFLLARPFLDTVGHTVALAGVVAVWLIVMCLVAFQLTRVGRVRQFVPRMLARRPLRWLPEAGAVLAAATLAGFVVRPYVQIVHGHPDLAEYDFIASLQRLQGLRVDPTRMYSEQTLYWVIWYIGLPTVLLAAFGLAIVVRRCLRALLTWRDPDGVWRVWALPLAVFCAGSLVVLWAPDIEPDQPWASRRLIVMVIPGLIVCALWAASWLARWARDRGAQPVTAAVAGAFCVAAMLVPTAATTFGVGLSHTGRSGGLTPVAQGLALTRTGAGEVTAVRELCARIPRNASVIIVDWPTASRFSQLIRGMCGVPVGWMAGQPVGAVETVIRSVSAAGRRPLLLASTPGRLTAFGGTAPLRVLDLTTTEDPHELTQLPTAPDRIRYQVWMAAGAASGART